MLKEPFIQTLHQLFQNNGMPLPPEQAERMAAYYGCLVRENVKYNLTAITGPEAAAEKHFLDSVIPQTAIPAGAGVIDVGSGGGFPAVPLAVVRGDLRVTALEASRKKCDFMEAAAGEAGIPLTVIGARAEEYARGEGREAYDVCVSRAVAPLGQLMELCAPLVKPGGLFLAYKADFEAELKQAENAAEALGIRLKNTVVSPVAGSGHAVLVFEKTTPVDERFPRKYNQILKRPL